MSDITKASLSQRAAQAMNRPDFPEEIIDSPTAQRDFVVAVSQAEDFNALPQKYKLAIEQAENGANTRVITP